MPRRRWSVLMAIAYYSGAIAVIVVGMMLIGGCATRTEVQLRERAQVAEARVVQLEGFLQGAQDDQAMLMGYIVKLETQQRELIWGMEEQARMAAKWRENCEL